MNDKSVWLVPRLCLGMHTPEAPASGSVRQSLALAFPGRAWERVEKKIGFFIFRPYGTDFYYNPDPGNKLPGYCLTPLRGLSFS